MQKNINMSMRKYIYAISSVMAIVATTSCIDERYDFDNVSEEIHLFENGISLPLLQTGDLYFGDLISSENQIVVNENGIYEIATKKGTVSVRTEVTEKVKVPEQELTFGTIKSYSVIVPEGISIFEKLPSECTNYNTNLNAQTETIDSKIVAIERVYTDQNWISVINFSVLDESGAPLSSAGGVSVEKIKFDNYKLVLPSALIIDKAGTYASGSINVTIDESNTLILNGETTENVVNVYVKLKGVIVGSESFKENKIVLNQNVSLNGDIWLELSANASSIQQGLQIRPSVYIPEVYMDEVYCRADMSDEMETETITIGSMPDFLKSSGTSLILTNPYLPIVIKSSLPMDALSADIKLVPKDEDGKDIYDDNGEKIEVNINVKDISPLQGMDVSYNYVACEPVSELNALGYKFIECKKLRTLIKKMPASIEISGEGRTDPNKTLHIFMGESYTVDLDYDVRIPFMLEESTNIVYEAVTEDLPTDIFETLSANHMRINAMISNGFPVDMSLEVEPFDEDGEKIEGIDIVVPKKIDAAKPSQVVEDVVPMKTNLRLEIKELIKGKMKKLGKLKWKIKVSLPEKGVISKYQTLNMKFSLELPKGFTIDMDNLQK